MLVLSSERMQPPQSPALYASVPQPTAATRGCGVLVVDDEEPLLDVMNLLLEEAGYTVYGAQSPEQALALHDRFRDHIDVLLTDIRMPTMSGTRLAATIRARQPSIRVVFVSGYADDHLDDPALRGRWSLLPKPFGGDDLVAAVRNALGSRLHA